MAPEKGDLTQTFLQQAQKLVIAKTQEYGAWGVVFGALLGLCAAGEISAILKGAAMFGAIGAVTGFANGTSHKANIIEAALKQQTKQAPKPDQGPRPSA